MGKTLNLVPNQESIDMGIGSSMRILRYSRIRMDGLPDHQRQMEEILADMGLDLRVFTLAGHPLEPDHALFITNISNISHHRSLGGRSHFQEIE